MKSCTRRDVVGDERVRHELVIFSKVNSLTNQPTNGVSDSKVVSLKKSSFSLSRHWTLSLSSSIRPSPSHPVSSWLILILPSMKLRSSEWSLILRFSDKILYVILIFTLRAICSVHVWHILYRRTQYCIK